MSDQPFVLATISVEAYNGRGDLVDAVLGGWSTTAPVDGLHSTLLAIREGLSSEWRQADPAAIRRHLEQRNRPQRWEQLDLFS